MSSSERAPEPTMEEILASIRRIISEDETSSADRRPSPRSQPAVEALEEVEGEADSQIITDIARVLSGGQSSTVSVIVEEEEILDLTAELGGLEFIDEEPQVLADEEPLDLGAFDASMSETAPDPTLEILDLDMAAAPEPQAPTTESFIPMPVAEVAPAPAMPEPLKRSASEEAASALERAIAALRAGQVPTSLDELETPPPSHKIALTGVREEEKVGQRTTLDVLDAQRELLNSQIGLVSALRDRVVAEYSLYAAIGRMDAQTLGLSVPYYDPIEHYDIVKNKWLGLRPPEPPAVDE